MMLLRNALLVSSIVGAWLCLALSSASAAPPTARPAAMPAVPGAVTWEQFPTPVRETIKRELNGIMPAPDKLMAKVNKKGEVEYGATAEINNKEIHVRVVGNGKLVGKREKEDIDAAKLPKPVTASVKRELGMAKVLTASKTVNNGKISYTVTGETNDRSVEVVVSEDGGFLRKEEAKKKDMP